MRIKKLRKGRGWSQRDMADLVGIELTRYQKWEQRGRVPAQFLPRLARLFNETIEFILIGSHKH